MGMSVLLGKNIYNITELLEKDVLNSLKGTDFEWLFHLLQHLGNGHISDFAVALNTYSQQLEKYPKIQQELTHLQ
jgi:26S proteasome regulatory subunit N9